MEEEKQNGQEKTSFIREKIVERPGKKTRRTLSILALAALCGILAGFFFWLTVTILPERGHNSETAEVTTAAETEPETTEPETTEPETTEEAIEDVIGEMLEQQEDVVSRLEKYTHQLYSDFASSMVLVTVNRNDTDWLNHTYQSEGTTQGIVIRLSGTKVYLLVNSSMTENAATLTAQIGDNSYEAQIVGTDSLTGMQVLSVETNGDFPDLMSVCSPVVLGLASSLTQGSFVMAVGSPSGSSESMCFGYVTFRDAYMDDPDYQYELIYTDMQGAENASGALINEKGYLVGWITERFRSAESGDALCALNINQIITIVNRILENSTVGYLGVIGTDVTAAQAESLGTDHGIYLRDVVTDSPAFSGGLQIGDILIGVNGTEIGSMKELQTMISATTPGTEWKLSVMRWSRDTYAQIEVPVTLGSRP